jgi:hypothetical protein
MNISCALQTCDKFNNQQITRYCSTNKNEVTKKCVTSFLNSIKYSSEIRKNDFYHITIFDDHSSDNCVNFLSEKCSEYWSNNVNVYLVKLETNGIMNSIRSCYEWLKYSNADLVYQVQDDYLFLESAIFELIEIFSQLKRDCDTDSIVIPFNSPTLWNDTYRYRPTPRTIIPGINRYWIQSYDIPCTFLTSHAQFIKHWGILERFLEKSSTDKRIEPDTLNKILTTRGVLGLLPIQSVALHMQDDIIKDPHINWKFYWDKIIL